MKRLRVIFSHIIPFVICLIDNSVASSISFFLKLSARYNYEHNIELDWEKLSFPWNHGWTLGKDIWKQCTMSIVFTKCGATICDTKCWLDRGQTVVDNPPRLKNIFTLDNCWSHNPTVQSNDWITAWNTFDPIWSLHRKTDRWKLPGQITTLILAIKVCENPISSVTLLF